MTTPKQRLTATMERLGLTISWKFVPCSKSRKPPNGDGSSGRSLNWSITLTRRLGERGNHVILTTDYTAGVGHCPSYRSGARDTPDYVEAIVFETEHGLRWRRHSRSPGGVSIIPDVADVMHSLISDSEAIDHPDFESWASDLGYDSDSRAAERTYRACVATGLAIRAGVGDAGLVELRESCQDY